MEENVAVVVVVVVDSGVVVRKGQSETRVFFYNLSPLTVSDLPNWLSELGREAVRCKATEGHCAPDTAKRSDFVLLSERTHRSDDRRSRCTAL